MKIAIFLLTTLLSITALGQTQMYAPPTAPDYAAMQPAPAVQPMQPAPAVQPMQPAPAVQPMQPAPAVQPIQPASDAASAPTVPGAPPIQYLLKSDFNILQGTVRQDGRYYIVQSVNGGTMFVTQEQTLAICNNMDEVYTARVAAISSIDVVSYLNLADWCIKYKMIDKAEQHLAYAKSIQNDYPYIPVIERRLALAKQQAEREMSGAENAPASGSNLNDPVTQINKLRSERASLEQIAKNMPGDTLRQFSTEIQPILLNSCGTANCHGSPNNSFQLIRTPQSHNITLKNLYSVLRQVDRNTPDASRLLVMSSQAHGGLDVPVFSRGRTSAYSRLVGWTYRVARPSQSMAMSNNPEYDSMFGNSDQPALADDSALPGQTESFADNSPAPQQPTDPAFDNMGNGDFDQGMGQLPSARRTSSPNVKRGNPDPMFYADQTPPPSDNSLASRNVMTLPPPPTGEPAPQYTSEFDYNGQGGSTVRTMQINGESYASPAGLPGPQNVPTPARQRLDQMETNQRLYGNPNGPAETQPAPQQLNASTQFDGSSSSLTEAERNFYGIQTPANPQQTQQPVAATNAPQQPQYPSAPGGNVPATSDVPQLASQQTPYPQTSNPQFQVPDAQLAPTSPAMGSNYQPSPTPAQTAPAQTAPAQTAPAQTAPAQTAPAQTAPTQTAPAQTAPAQTAPAQTAAPVRQRRTPPPSDYDPDGYDAHPRLDKLFGG